MVQLYSDKINLIERFNIKSLENEISIIPSINELNTDSTIITDPDMARILLKKFPFSKIMVLSDAPSFAEGSKLLPLGIRGYGNTYIHLKHLTQAMITIENGAVWLYPSFMRQLIHGAASSSKKKSDTLDRLTERERETALLVKDGKSNKEIATALDITERTVKQHMSNIFEKLGVSDRLSLAMLLK
ncbi:MAG: response regulator transcription factor [Campylobacterota bacterium]|nr:response regulator transcription factor [Campylobacterota bacterium]